MPQSHHGQEADDADEDCGAFQDSRADETQRDPFVLLLEHREQRDGGADAGKCHNNLKDATDDDRSVRAETDHVVRIVYRTVESECRNRDKGEQVEHARRHRDFTS